MANTLDGGSFAEYWSKRMQSKFNKIDVFRSLANWEGQEVLKDGDVYNKPYRSAVATQSYTRGIAFNPQDLTNAVSPLTVNQTRIVAMYFDDLDVLQSKYSLINEYADDAAVKLHNWIDADFLYCAYYYPHTDNTVDDADINSGGTADIGFTPTVANIPKIFSNAGMKLNQKSVGMEKRYIVIGPELMKFLVEYLDGKDSALGDKVGERGYIGYYMGFDVYMSNNLTGTCRLAMATLPTDADTIVIDGVTFTWETGTRDSAGEVYAQTDAATSIDNLIACIDLSGTSGTEYYPLSTANQGKADAWETTDGSSYIDFVLKGVGYPKLSETLSAAADGWTANKQIQNVVAGQVGAVSMIVQKYPKVNTRAVSDKLGVNVVPHILFGATVFQEDKERDVKIMVRSDEF